MHVSPYQELQLIDDRSVFLKQLDLLPEGIKDMKDVERANRQLHSIWSLYNGHMQISLNSRDEILESKFMKSYIKEISLMREEITLKDAEIESMRTLLDTWATKDRQMMESQIASMEDYAEEELD